MSDGKKRILIVDDEEAIRNLAKTVLEARGFEVITASDGKEAVQLTKSQKPDLVVMDVNMPKMNGFDALKQIKKDKATMSIPVLMLTTRNSEDDMRTGIENYADKYLPKPFTPQKLILEIEQALSYK